MSKVTMKINLSPTKAGELYMKWSNLVKEVEKLEQEKKDLVQTLGREELIKIRHEMALTEIENLVTGYEGDMADSVRRVVEKSL